MPVSHSHDATPLALLAMDPATSWWRGDWCLLAAVREQRSIKPGQSQIVRWKCCLCYLCYLICIWIQCCFVDSCESSICIHFHSIVCLFSSVYVQHPVSSPQVAKQKSIHFDNSERVWKAHLSHLDPKSKSPDSSYRLNPPCGPGFEVIQISAARIFKKRSEKVCVQKHVRSPLWRNPVKRTYQ